MMDEPTSFERREAKYNFLFRVVELVVCTLCLGIFIAFACLCSLFSYTTAIIVCIAALTALIVIAALIVMLRLRKKQKSFHKGWIFIALASMIGYFGCIAVFVLEMPAIYPWLLFLSLGMAAFAALVFLLDFIFNLQNKLILNKNKIRRNQIMPNNTMAVQNAQEKTTPENIEQEKLAPNNELCDTIECSVIVGDQLACNQQLCHVKWSEDQASRTPTAKLIYVQPCTSSVTKICPACKKFNCEKCFQKKKHEEERNLPEPQRAVKSTQFPEDNDIICPICTSKAGKVYKTTYVQTSEEQAIPESILKKTRNVHSAKSMERPSRASNKLIQSSPATPRKTWEHLMVCPKCRKRSVFMSKISKGHVCPLCKQECQSQSTCTSCFYTVSSPFSEEERRKSTEAEAMNEDDRKRVKSPCFKKKKQRKSSPDMRKSEKSKSRRSISPEPEPPLVANEMTQVSPEDFEEKLCCIKVKDNKLTQVSSKDFIEAEAPPPKPHLCCACNKNETTKIELRETETQVSLDRFMAGSSGCLQLQPQNNNNNNKTKANEYKTTNISSKELAEEIGFLMLNQSGTEKIYENKSFGNQSIVNESVGNGSTQVSPRDFQQPSPPKVLFEEVQSRCCTIDEDKLTQVSSRDFVQKERQPCGAPNCMHPMCTKHNIVQVISVEQTQEHKSKCGKTKTDAEKECCCSGTGTGTGTGTTIEYVNQETLTDQFKQISCQTTESLEKTNNRMLREELPECIDPNCTCVINNKEVLVCMYCKSMHNKTSGKSPEGVKVLEASSKNDKCFCQKTEKGLLRCTFCEEAMYLEKNDKQKAGAFTEIMDKPLCSPAVNTCYLYQKREQGQIENNKINQIDNVETGNNDQMKTERSYRKSSEDEEQKNKSSKASENNEKDDEDADASSASEPHSNDTKNRVYDKKYLTPREIKTFYKKEREEMSKYLANKDVKRYSPPPPEALKNVTVFTLQKKIEVIEVEEKESDIEKTDEDDDGREKMKMEWEALAGKHAAYQNRIRKNIESNIKIDDDTKLLENTQTEMENIYNCMIKNLLERQSHKENNLILLERLNCNCDSDDAESTKHEAECSARNKEATCKQNMFKQSPFFQLNDFKKFNIETGGQKGNYSDDNDDNDDNDDDDDDDVILFDIKKPNLDKSSSEIMIMSENVSLSTITEEISGTPSDLISVSKESEPSNSKEQLQKKQDEKLDLNAMKTTVDPQEVKEENLKTSCKRDIVFVQLPEKFQRDKRGTEIQSARCKNVSPRSCSGQSEKCPRKSAGFYEPSMFSPTFGSTKTSFTASDNESIVDNVKTFKSTTSSTVSFNLLEDPSPKEEASSSCQSQSVPITSRATALTNEQKMYYCRHSIPCTPKKIRWQETQPNFLTDVSETSTKQSGRSTFRKESDYDEGNEAMIVLKHFHPQLYEADRNRENEFGVPPKIVPPLPIANITPEHSESEDSRPISCSSHFSARTLQTIDNYNLECSSSLKKNPKYMRLQEMKQSRKSLLGMKSQPLSSRAHPIVEKAVARKYDVKLKMEPTIRERHISAPSRTSQKKKAPSPKLAKAKSATGRPFRQKTNATGSAIIEKRKSAKKSKMKSEPVSPEREHLCHCEFYKKSRNNYCRIHGMGAQPQPKIQSVPISHRSNISNSGCSPKSPKRRSITPNMNMNMNMEELIERPKTVEKSDEMTPKSVDNIIF